MGKYKIYIDRNTSLNDETLNQQMSNYYDKGIVALDFKYQGDGPLFIKKAKDSSYKKIDMRLGDIIKSKAKINLEKCISCGTCKDICPEHAISDNSPYIVDESICTGCGDCISGENACPVNAISINKSNIYIDVINIDQYLPNNIRSSMNSLNIYDAHTRMAYIEGAVGNLESGRTKWGTFVKQ